MSAWFGSGDLQYRNLTGTQFVAPHSQQLKVPYYAKFTSSLLSDSNMYLQTVNALPRIEKSSSFSSFASFTFQK